MDLKLIQLIYFEVIHLPVHDLLPVRCLVVLEVTGEVTGRTEEGIVLEGDGRTRLDHPRRVFTTLVTSIWPLVPPSGPRVVLLLYWHILKLGIWILPDVLHF